MAELRPLIRFKIHKSQCLGRGSYGAVYRAEFDSLPCAAKVLHPILLQGGDPGAVTIMERFKQECQLLGNVWHPNIVQCLGVCRDPDVDSGDIALLMELMDESLTHFLKHSQQPLPYHMEVNLCHDIALALAYLHSHRIIHRDLSSNNVLLIAGSRAKVTDFGMSKMLNVSSQATPFTLCPGTAVYMSPEAVKNPPVYTDKLDCFSFGVLEIQIMTRQFPNPGPDVHEIADRRSRTGRIQIPIPDSERRKSHIDLIDPTHSLLPIALRCLSYSERERPSALDLCQLVAALKGSPQYTQSVQKVQECSRLAPRATATIVSSLQEEIEQRTRQNHQLAQQTQDLQQQLVALREQNLRKKQEVQQLVAIQKQNERQVQQSQWLQQQVVDRDKQISTLQQQLEVRENRNKCQVQELRQQVAARDAQIQTLRQQLAAIEKTQQSQEQVAARDAQIQTLRQQLVVRQKQNERKVKDLQQQLVARDARTEAMQSSSQALQNDTLAVKERKIQQLEQAYLEKQHTIEAKEIRLQQLEKQSQANEQFLAEFQLANNQLVQELERIRHPVEGTAVVEATVQPLDDSQPQKTTQNISWQKGDNAPEAMSRGSSASKGEVVYFNPSGSPAVHAYNSRRQHWFRLPDCPHTSSAMVIVRGMVTAVGGQKNSEPTNLVLSLAEEGESKNWKEYFSPMPTGRFSLAAVCIGRFLIAAGGYCDSVLRAVEILDIDSQQWYTATSLPHPCYQASAAVWEDKLYLLSGLNQKMNLVRSVLTCSVPELLQSCQPQSNLRTSDISKQSSLWHQIALTPFFNSTCATVRGRLLAIGGNDETDKDMRAIHVYNPTSNSWQAMRTMPTARHCALVAVLPGDQLMVVGGWGEQRVLWNKEPTKLSTVEFCYFS